MYWNDTEIKEVGYGSITNNSGLSERRNIQATFADPKSQGSTLEIEYDVNQNKDRKQIKSINMANTLYWRFGTVDT